MDKELNELVDDYYGSLNHSLDVFTKEMKAQVSDFLEDPVHATRKINGLDCNSTIFTAFLGLLLFYRPTYYVRWIFFSENAKRDAVLELEHYLRRFGIFVRLPPRAWFLRYWLYEKEGVAEQEPTDEK
jgi:hypothetical protein